MKFTQAAFLTIFLTFASGINAQTVYCRGAYDCAAAPAGTMDTIIGIMQNAVNEGFDDVLYPGRMFGPPEVYVDSSNILPS
jgi:hypothetical protein